MRFAKYQALGNDFVVVDRRAGGTPLAPEAVRRLCDRHLGIGADGVLSLWEHSGAAARMQVQNADGSEASMCGNGIRCVARYLQDRGLRSGELRIAVGEQLYRVRRTGDDRFEVNMGRARTTHADLPRTGADGQARLEVGGRELVGTPVWIGNPHFVIFGDDDPRRLAELWGAALEKHPAYPARTNVGFGRFGKQGLDLVVFERGVGITQACGSGACAAGVAAVARGKWPAGEPLTVRLPGGTLLITASAEGEVSMEGEAHPVFEGEVVV